MALLRGFNHVAVLTANTDRFHAFYREVFDAQVVHEHRDGDVRFSLVDVGPHARLNVFEINGNGESQQQIPMFGRGRLDHFGLEASSQEAFDEIRKRLIVKGASDGFVTDFGAELSVFFRDPDGLEGEVLFEHRPGYADVNPPGTKAEGYEPVA